ncbi:ImuA family protein [Sulfitobacter sp. 1A13421]|uniref:ImuA family protein n=1 Tax=Sulfitobacter sp. 1A13421 TaxID=3368595 RepID=UPI0037458DA7
MTTDSTYGQVLTLPRRRPSTPPEPGVLATHAPLTDVFPQAFASASASGFVLSLLPRGKGPVLWVQDFLSRRENGAPYTPSLAAFGLEQPVLLVNASHPRDVLWAMEEGAACAGLSAVVGEVHGGPEVLDFTATKRLSLRAEASGVPLYLIRSGDPGGLSAARMRWRIASLPAQAHPDDPQAPGAARWDLELFRARGHAPGRWVADHEADKRHSPRAADRLRLVPRSDDGALAPGDQPIPQRSGG